MVNQNPLVSVLVVTYQHAQFIRQCLDGILMQKTTFPIEIIIGEDESTDGTREICIEYAKKFPDKIKLFLRSRKDVIYINGKPTGRFNMVENLKAASGEYIALCEGDDYWSDSLKLQQQVEFLENNPDYVLSCHNASVVNEKGDVIKLSQLERSRKVDFTREELMSGRHVLTLTMCFRNIISEFPQEFYKSVNGDTFLTAMLGEFGQAKFQKEIKNGIYRVHSNGLWSTKEEYAKINDKRNTYFQLFKFFKPKKNEKVIDTLFSKYYGSSQNLLGFYIQERSYFNCFKLYFILLKNCLYYRYITKSIQISKFVLKKI